MFTANLPVRWFASRWVTIAPLSAVIVALTIIAQPALAENAASDTVASNPAASPAVGVKATADNAAVQQWISQLGAADYRAREEAVRQLSAAGGEAIKPLIKAAHSDDLEVSYRAVRVLQSLLDRDDLTLQQQAADALQTLANSDDHAPGDLAADALEVFQATQQDRALETLRRLGATVGMGFGDIDIVINSQWHGKSADLAFLKQAQDLKDLRIVFVKLDDEALKTLGELNQLEKNLGSIELYGTGVSSQSAAALAQALGHVKIDRRNGAMLGVGPSMASGGCFVGRVVEDSAARIADIREGDEIVSIDGHPVEKFEELTALIGDKNVGDSATIEVRRDGQLLEKHVVLGRWMENPLP
jgi:hypothetical protein